MLDEELLLIQLFSHTLNLLKMLKLPKIVNLTMLLFLAYISIVDILVTLKLSKNTLTFTSPLVNTTNTITLNESAITTLTNFYNKTTSDGRYLQLTGGNISSGTLNFDSRIENFLINLWGTNEYGFGINSGMLR